MRRLDIVISLTLICLAGCQPASAASFISTGDGGWEWVKPAPSVHDWGAVFFLDAKTGWAVGSDCVILKTTDGGTNWAPQGQRVRKLLTDVCFTDPGHGWAVGKGYANLDPTGIILKTEDGGATWRKVMDGKTSGLMSVHFVDNSVGWAVGRDSTVIKSVDGGETWARQECPVPGKPGEVVFSSVTFVDENRGWFIASNRYVYRTTDGGKTWSHSRIEGPGILTQMQFIDAKVGWILSSRNTLHRTIDGGSTWSEVSLNKTIPPDKDFPSAGNIRSFCFCDALNGVAVSSGGRGLRTRDGGRTWVLAAPMRGDTVSQPHAYMADDNNAWAVGYNGQMMRTTDGGATWQSLSWGRDDYTHGIVFIDPKVGWAVGKVANSRGPAGVLLKTEDGGMTWTRRQIEHAETVRGICFLDQELGWATTTEGIIKTTDGGATWLAQGQAEGGFFDPVFVDPLNGWVLGGGGTISRTPDGGQSWVKLNTGTMDQLYGVHFANERTGWICGQSGRIMKTTDAGTTWKRQGSGTVDLLADLHFVNEKTGWVCGTRGAILKTTDGGETWVPQKSGKSEQITGISFVNENEGWAAGLGTTVVHTTDGGQTWTAQDYGTWNGVWDVRFTDASNGCAVGGPMILRTTTGGVPGAVWAKKQADGTQADFGHLVVTRKSEGYLLAEHPDSRVGIHIKTLDSKPNVGDYIYIHGRIATENGERVVVAESTDIQCAGWGVLPAK